MKNLLTLCLILSACDSTPTPDPMPDAGGIVITVVDAHTNPDDDVSCLNVPGCDGPNLICTESGSCVCHPTPDASFHCLRFKPCDEVCPAEEHVAWYTPDEKYRWTYCYPSYNRCDDPSKHN